MDQEYTDRGALVDRLAERAQWIRLETVRLISIAKSGHYTSVFSCAELFAVLYYHVLRLRPSEPQWLDRDRFVLSKGHAAVGLYPVLADLGYFPVEWLDSYTRVGSPLGDHPDMRKIPGIDFSSGSLGQGLSVAIGMALGGRLNRRDYQVYCMLGDGELHEGQIWEAAMAAKHFQLSNLVVIVDRNQMSLDGFTEEIMAVEPIGKHFRGFGWAVHEVDGHDIPALLATFDALPATGTDQPHVIVARTVKGKGVSFMELNPDWHLGHLAEPDRQRVEQELRGDASQGKGGA